ncbi:MAG TPA: hypothetical protein VIL32_00150 [Steroidobacteraceae bacterium]
MKIFLVRLSVAALLLGLSQACVTSSEEAEYRRATVKRVTVSGSRIKREVDPRTGEVATGYPLEQYQDSEARAEFDALRDQQRNAAMQRRR